ncbi:MAG: type I DNA topoisomerase [Alloprevotella sp.]|nr:type I DNA topoisomerase [Alloprevotella sp.]
MQKNLVIVESPAKAKTIEKFLGKDFKVMSSFGHIRDLKKKNFGVNLDTFEPEYEISEDKQKVVADLQAQAGKSEKVWLASDEDREGEAISWHLAEVLGLDAAAQNRIVFHEITKPAILTAIEHPRSIDLNLVDAQQARRVLDRLVGFKLSPVLWRKVRPSLSAGRVQSVAVRLIVEREREVAAFRAEESYHVTALFVTPETDGAAHFKAELRRHFKTKEEAHAFLEHCASAAVTVRSVTKKPTNRTPPQPFTTSTLQQEAARRLGFPVALTMRVAQGLYEAGLITYMRTDSTNLSALFLNTCGPVIEKDLGAGYHQRRNYRTSTKGAQEAHEAIRPTDVQRRKISGTAQERRLYDLIWKRTLASQTADAEFERTTAEISTGPAEDVFVATGDVVKFDGFFRIYRDNRETEPDTDNFAEGGGLLPVLREGTQLGCREMSAQQRFTQPPARYNEAALVHKLEELGIGRPSTYAPTISTIQQRDYVSKGDKPGKRRKFIVLTLKNGQVAEEQKTETVGAEKSRLIPTDIGIVVNDFLLEHFSDILDYNFTATVEKDFDDVAEGKEDWVKVIRTFYDRFEPEVENAVNEKTERKAGERELGHDPQTGKVISVKIGRFGPMVQLGTPEDDEKPRFATLKPQQSLSTITLEEALELFRLPREVGLLGGIPIVANAGRFGPYVQHGKTFASIPKGENPLSITLERATELLEQKRAAEEQKHLKTFSEDPDMQILNGRFGPYLAYKDKNYKLPKALAARAKELTLEECLDIVAEEAKKPARPTRGRRGR